MIFYNIGDGYSSGCCTGNLYTISQDDPKYFGAKDIEHPDNKPGSFITNLADMYKARPITVGRHNLTLEVMLDNLERYESEIAGHNDQITAFIGIPDLYTFHSENEEQFKSLFGVDTDYSTFVGKHLLLNGTDNLGELTPAELSTYQMMCEKRKTVDVAKKIEYLEMFIQRISNITHKVIVYRTTHLESLDLNLPNNVTFLNESIIEILSKQHQPHRRGYFDKEAYKTLQRSFLKLL